MTPGKEGLPTPRECWNALKRVSVAYKTGTHSPMQMIVDHIELKLLSRLTDEAMALDEKRRSDLEELAAVSRRSADWQYSDLHDHGVQPSSLTMDARDILRRLDGPLRRDLELDALAPAPQEPKK